MKWVLGAVWAAYLILQVVAIRRLHGETRKRCLAVLPFMVIAMLLANGVKLVFESQAAKKVELVILGVLGSGAIVMLSRLLLLERNSVLRAEG